MKQRFYLEEIVNGFLGHYGVFLQCPIMHSKIERRLTGVHDDSLMGSIVNHN